LSEHFCLGSFATSLHAHDDVLMHGKLPWFCENLFDRVVSMAGASLAASGDAKWLTGDMAARVDPITSASFLY
jgi:hypothetical protein